MRAYHLGLALMLFFLSLSSQALAERRVALVIGNSAYENVPVLPNPRNDATDMAAKLRDLGFEVVSGEDLDLRGVRTKIRDFIERLDGADMALFFYAGHGLQVNGENYMAPVDAELSSYIDLDFEAVPINLVLSAMERSSKINLIFLDACRDNPLVDKLSRSMGTRSSSVGRGLAKLGSGIGSLISFATQPGNVALDGDGRNSPFTTALLRHLGTPGQDITRDLVQVRRDVLEKTAGKQVPWETSSLTGDIVLKAEAKKEPVGTYLPAVPDNTIELVFWDTIKTSEDRSLFEVYLEQFPQGVFAQLARAKMAIIDRKAADAVKQMELARQVEADQLAEAERQKRLAQEAELARQAEVERQAKADQLAEAARQQQLAQEAELARQAEVERQAQADQLAEAARQKRLAQEAELARQAEIERQAQADQLAEAARQKQLAQEAELARQAEIERQAQADQLAEAERQKRLAQEAERQAQIAQQQAEAVEQAEAARQARVEKQAELDKQAALSRELAQKAAADAAADSNAKPQELALVAPSATQDILSPETVKPSDEAAGPDRELIRSVQRELNRVGCSAGSPDGLWGSGSRRALEKFKQHGKVRVATLEPSAEVLKGLMSTKTRVCPLVCGSKQKEERGRCVAARPETKPVKQDKKRPVEKAPATAAQPEKKTQKVAGSCPESAWKAAMAHNKGYIGLWQSYVVGTHPCGRKYACTRRHRRDFFCHWQ